MKKINMINSGLCAIFPLKKSGDAQANVHRCGFVKRASLLDPIAPGGLDTSIHVEVSAGSVMFD